MKGNKVIHVSPGLDSRWAGIATAVEAIVHRQRGEGRDALLLAVDDRSDRSKPLADWMIPVADDTTPIVRSSRNVVRALSSLEGVGEVNIHGLWTGIGRLVAAFARKHGIAYHIWPHGMLAPRALKRSVLKKRLAMLLWQRCDLHGAESVMVLSDLEREGVDVSCPGCKIELVEAPIVVPENIAEIKLTQRRRDVVGYLGRLDPDKGVHKIIEALPSVPSVCLEIAGRGSRVYEKRLRHLVEKYGLSGRVTFLGHVSGDEKFKLLASWAMLIMPSDYESYGMSAAEALLVGTPVAASSHTPWSHLPATAQGYFGIDTSADIARVISAL